MRTGDLRRRVTFQTRSTTKDTFGQQATTWSDLLSSVPAEIAALSGRETLAAQAVSSEVTHTITVRYHSLFADPVKVAAMRIVYVNAGVTRYFNIMSAKNVDERNRWIEISAAEGLTPG